jgi:molybdopterin-guanine dinucleotide biosynthesis protein MobB
MRPTPVLGFAAFSGTGKTTLLSRLIPVLRQHGLRLGLIKHGHHGFEIDKPGKDSYVLRRAGAVQMLVASARRTVLMREHGAIPTLSELIARVDHDALDLILIEGFKHQPIPKIELHRPSLGHPLLCLEDRYVIAVAADAPLTAKVALPVLDLNVPSGVADFILNQFLVDSVPLPG